MSALANYFVPVTIDHAGRYPGKRPGDTWCEEHHGRRFQMTLVDKPYNGKRPGFAPPGGGSIFCTCHVKELPA